ncbi:hypothetical protein NKG94_05325 [Micromonospora sp. M12]
MIGHGWASAALTPYTLRSGAAPGRGEVVIDADLAGRSGSAVGGRLLLTTKTGTRTMVVSGVAAPSGEDGLPAQGALFVADGEVAVVSGLPGPTAVALRTEPGTDPVALRDAVGQVAGDHTVLTGVDRVRADLPGALPDYIGPISIFGFVIGITAFAAVFVLTGTVTLGVRQRLRELALLRTAGATPVSCAAFSGGEPPARRGRRAARRAAGVVFAHLVAARFRSWARCRPSSSYGPT